MARYTPMIEQYLSIKKQAADALLFFRLGDFYELFFDDAIIASRELEITLTGRDGGQNERIPMCGVPHHSSDSYIQRLVEKGYKVAICEQVEDPAAAKGIVRREIIRVVTPGTIMEGKNLSEKTNLFLAAVVSSGDLWGSAFCDLSTGEFYVAETDEASFYDDMLRLSPSEVIVYKQDIQAEPFKRLAAMISCVFTEVSIDMLAGLRPLEKLHKHYGVITLESFGLKEYPLAAEAAGVLLAYLESTQKRELPHIKPPQYLVTAETMTIDSFSRRNLELVESLREKSKTGSLLWLLDETVTAMGGRLLKRWIERPLAVKQGIEERLDAVEEWVQELLVREDIRALLDQVYDLERLIGRVAYGSANARDLLAIRSSLAVLPDVKNCLERSRSTLLLRLSARIPDLSSLVELIERAIVEEPPVSIREGGLIKEGFDARLDEYKIASRDGKRWIAELEQREREKTGIKSLKVGYNKVFGYYLEVSKANLSLVPPYFERKQTLANGERYITPELKEKEALILEAEEKMVDLEYQIFLSLRERVEQSLQSIQEAAEAIAEIDVIQSLATVAVKRRYVRPVITEGDRLLIEEGRHPVVEAMQNDEPFVPNDTLLDCDENQIALITGPNMAGKSTYMRQVALLVIMAQIGSFVPARRAEVGIVDRVFTRIGASDNLAGGQSTFMVEMVELANILHHATRRSLIILDEIGRGTSTFDGMSIAQAVIEYLHHSPKVGAKTMFATHYHELTKLAETYRGVRNYSTHVQEKDDTIVFLRKILPEPADRSYGIQVAKLAGLPREVLDRAQEILQVLQEEGAQSARETAAAKAGEAVFEDASLPSGETLIKETQNDASLPISVKRTVSDGDAIREAGSADREQEAVQLSLFSDSGRASEIVDELKRLNLMQMTPLDAMNTLFRLQKMAFEE
ncbi:DNA mismatch repair protein MutS [Collibacillus ludicampi]|uniref:DNA mismatch repair protein MutS n=1 Tax=Collibacillus ludicampi TaxID=2771369 RepID=A0AAV4LJH5_9BACL|nr:DNA mismatch repair protein MutS [Collibacillus ludicampi]GIM47918.1 DNA mismatch repair protein MutS [Collibacillus ludicampi]